MYRCWFLHLVTQLIGEVDRVWEEMGTFATRNKIRTVLGWNPIEIRNSDPNKTILEYLRNDANLVGTKEGCAEGDCGACTIIVGELCKNKICYKAVNACILFLPFIDGKQILSVENIASDILHPVQQALVQFHGSQCGFCTPGIVMSLVAHHLNRGAESRKDIDEVLAGNLCRCTGYGTIIDATKQALKSKPDQFLGKVADKAYPQLLEWKKDKVPLKFGFKGMKFFAPVTADQLKQRLARKPRANIIAGMTDVGLWVTKGGRLLKDFVSLLCIDELKEIKVADGGIEIFAAVTYSDAREVLEHFSKDLGGLISRIGGTQIRNCGTFCGNIANGSPIGDMPPPLIALGASIVLRSLRGKRIIPLEEFFLDYGKQDLREGEFVQSIQIPKLDGIFRCYKVSKRFDQDISAVLGAFYIKIVNNVVDSARVSFGGMASTPKRASLCEAILLGSEWNTETVMSAQQALDKDFTPISDVRASKEYRCLVARNLIERFFLDTKNGERRIMLSDRTSFETLI